MSSFGSTYIWIEKNLKIVQNLKKLNDENYKISLNGPIVSESIYHAALLFLNYYSSKN